jgi:iron complex outermembrane receptor protein
VNIFVPTTPGVGVFKCQNPVLFHVPGTGNASTGEPNGTGTFEPITVSDPNACNHVFKLKSQRPTWEIDLNYKPTSDIMLYLKYARGYRAGSITSNSIGLELVGPEQVDLYEVGAKTSFRGAISGYFNVAGFYNNFRNQQLTVNTVIAPAYLGIIPPAAPNVNAGKSRIWGIEVESSVNLWRQLQIDLGYTYLNTKLLSFNPPPTPPYYAALFPATDVGGPLALSPKNRITVSAHYSPPLDESIGRITFGGTFVHTDANPATTPAATPVYLVKESNLLNLDASWNSILGSTFDLSFFMTNVTNEGLILFPSQSYHQIGIDGGHVNEPRMWGFRLKYHFGD